MGNRVLLIYPPSRRILREDRCQVPSRVIISPELPPTDLLYMAAVAEEEGFVCKVEDYTSGNRTIADFVAELKEFRPDWLVISATTPTLDSDLAACSVAKSVLPGIKTVAKGAHFLKFGSTVLESYPALDMAIREEAEATLREILRGEMPEDIKGIFWRSNGDGIVENTRMPFIEDLDTLPFPARHLIDNGSYTRPDNNSPLGVIKVSRGCPQRCFFCLAGPVSGTEVRMRSPENIIEELSLCVDKYEIKDFIFWSDIFSKSSEWVRDLCDAIVDSGLDIRWSSNFRADTVDLEIAKAMKRAGCTLVSIGVESGNQEILDKAGKGIRLDQFREAFGIIREAGLKTFAYYLIGLPWESRETFEDTIRFAVELDSDFASFFIAAPLPGTAFFDYAVEHGLLDPKGMNGEVLYHDAYYSPIVKSHYLNVEEIAGLQGEAVRRFHLRPKYMLRTLKNIRSLREVYNYTSSGLSVLRTCVRL